METDGESFLAQDSDWISRRSLILYSCLIAPALLVVWRVLQFFMDMHQRAKAINRLPHDPIHWLWGHVHMYPIPDEERLTFKRNQAAKFPHLYSVWFGNYIRPSVIVQHPDTVKMILKTTEPKPLSHGLYRYGLPWLGEGLLLASGKQWARNRRLLTPAFHFDILKNYISIKNKAVDLFLDKLEKCVKEEKNFEFFGNVSLLTFDVVLRCACSYENDVQMHGENHPYVQAVANLGDLWLDRTMKPWMHFEFLYRFTKNYREYKKNAEYVHSISSQVIEQRRKYLAEKSNESLNQNGSSNANGHSAGNGIQNGKNNTTQSCHENEVAKKVRNLDFLDILLTARDEDGNGLSDIEIRNEVDTFLFEGHDTTASSIAWVLYSLAENMQHQVACQQEIDEILAGRKDDYITWEDLPKFKYLTLCIKESMRCHCPVPSIARETSKEMTVEGVTLPKGTVFDLQLYNLHHNPHVWDNPMEFRPSRFLSENFDKMDSFAFVPFSAGPRNCIGQQFAMHEQKIAIARILSRYTIHLDPNFKIQKKIGVVMKTKDGMYMKAVPRTRGR